MQTRGWLRLVAAALAVLALDAGTCWAQWQIESKDGKASLKFGFLVQPQVETLETADQTATSTNLFVRRFRILLGGNFSEKWSYFFETDSPNIGKANPVTGAKDAGDIFVQDVYVTYNHSMAVKVDVGMIMLPHSRNGTQSAATLLAVDYGGYTFLDAGPAGERVGRDYGVQLRGYPAKQRLEYRLAVSQGVRGVNAKNPLEVSGRAVYYPWGAETGFFYGGTFQGTRKQAGFGGGFAVQDEASILSADAFFEVPTVKKSQGLTLQFNWMRYDGGAFLPSLPEQQAWLLEAGYHLANHKLSPFVQYVVRDFSDAATPDQNSLQVGVAWWLAGHQRNIKFSIGRQSIEGQESRTQALLQLQLFYF
jgi:hypothetical protein